MGLALESEVEVIVEPDNARVVVEHAHKPVDAFRDVVGGRFDGKCRIGGGDRDLQ